MILSVEENIKNNCLIKSSKIETKETLEENSNNNNLNNEITNHNTDNLLTDNKIVENNNLKENKNLENKSEDDKSKTSVYKDNNNLEEINLDIQPLDNDEISIKKPNEVYIEIYKSALEKAQQIKKAAMEAYSDAQKIKQKYNLNNLEFSDDDLNLISELQE